MKVEFVGGIRKKMAAAIKAAQERGEMIEVITLDAEEWQELQQHVPEGKTINGFMNVPVKPASGIVLAN